jgi:hypothetical protein
MNEIFVARKAFAATFTSSAVAVSVTMYGVPSASIGAYASRIVSSALRRRRAHHDAVGMQRVVDGEALSEELGIPRHLDVDTLRHEGLHRGRKPGRCANGDCRLAD